MNRISNANGSFCCPGETRFFLLEVLVSQPIASASLIPSGTWMLFQSDGDSSGKNAHNAWSSPTNLTPAAENLGATHSLTQSIPLQPAVVLVVGIGVIKPLSHSSCFGVGMDSPECIQHPSVVFWRNRSGVIPGFPKVTATSS